MSFVKQSLGDFTEVLASKAAVPGGGGASALVGAVGMALGNMVGSLTVGKKKYADVEADIIAAMEKSEAVRLELLRLIDADAEAFEPLSKAYGIPKDDPTRAETMENALKVACGVPMDIMRTVCRAIDLVAEFGAKGSALAISDAGVGAVCCKAALQGASLNVFINTKAMQDRTLAAAIETEASAMLEKYCALADEIYTSVSARLK
jgi:formiminotetrahydrofolate cyclodeaminase